MQVLSRRTEIIRIRAEINEIETKKITQGIRGQHEKGIRNQCKDS
jgi:hypothetical protein